MNGPFPQISGQVFRKSWKLPVDKKKPLTNVTKNAILDGAGVLQTHLGGAFLGWTLLKDERNKVQPSVVFIQKQELNPASYN